jgi:hypothetical protein
MAQMNNMPSTAEQRVLEGNQTVSRQSCRDRSIERCGIVH